MTERTVSEIREEIFSRLYASDEGLTLDEIVESVAVEVWIVEAIITKAVAEGKIVLADMERPQRFAMPFAEVEA
jgi:hypothetical protein